MEGAPAIAIEVISPNNLAADVQAKTQLYFEFGALKVWYSYPKTRSVVVFSGGPDQVRTEREFVTTPLLPGFSLNRTRNLRRLTPHPCD